MYPRIPSLLLICGFCTSRLRSAEQARWVRRHRDTRAVRTRRPQHVQNTRGLREKRGPATVSAPQASQNPSCLLSRAIRTGATFPATAEQRESLSESALFSAPFLLEPSLSLPVRSRGLSMESSTSCAFLPHMPVPGGGGGRRGRAPAGPAITALAPHSVPGAVLLSALDVHPAAHVCVRKGRGHKRAIPRVFLCNAAQGHLFFGRGPALLF